MKNYLIDAWSVLYKPAKLHKYKYFFNTVVL